MQANMQVLNNASAILNEICRNTIIYTVQHVQLFCSFAALCLYIDGYRFVKYNAQMLALGLFGEWRNLITGNKLH